MRERETANFEVAVSNPTHSKSCTKIEAYFYFLFRFIELLFVVFLLVFATHSFASVLPLEYQKIARGYREFVIDFVRILEVRFPLLVGD